MTQTKDEALNLALDAINKAREKVASLCDGKERWTMSVPVRTDYDHDVVISGALSMAEDAIKQALAAPTVQEPVAIYQYQMGDGSWIDQEKHNYDYNVRYGQATVRIVYTTPPAQPAPASWMEIVVANLVREGVNKHKARELAEHFYSLAQRPFVGLTDEEILELLCIHSDDPEDWEFEMKEVRAIEAKLRSKNNG